MLFYTTKITFQADILMTCLIKRTKAFLYYTLLEKCAKCFLVFTPISKGRSGKCLAWSVQCQTFKLIFNRRNILQKQI